MTPYADTSRKGSDAARTERPAITVIVPVYNVAAYLPQCLDSLLQQSFRDFEIVIVDDGSTDGSARIIERYASRHAGLIRVVHKPNGGLGDARNAGLACAHGRYVSFVDADDTVAPEMLARMHERAVATGADIVVCGILDFVDGASEAAGTFHPEPEMAVFGHSLAEEPRLLYRVGASACDKLYARPLFTRTGVLFPVGLAFEDLPTTYRLLAAANRVEKVDLPLYRYRHRRPESITAHYGANFLDLLEGFRILDAEYSERGIFAANRGPLLRLHLTHLIAGRYPDLFLRASGRWQRAFARGAFDLLHERFGDWRRDPVCKELWPNPLLRAVSSQRWLLDAFCRLPERAYLGLLRRMGAFDPSR